MLANELVPGALTTGAPPLPGKRTTVWHFGHFTLKARSGTFASSMTMRCWQLVQLACTGYLSIKSSSADGADRDAPLDGADANLPDGVTSSVMLFPPVSSTSWRLVRFVA